MKEAFEKAEKRKAFLDVLDGIKTGAIIIVTEDNEKVNVAFKSSGGTVKQCDIAAMTGYQLISECLDSKNQFMNTLAEGLLSRFMQENQPKGKQ